MTFKLEKNAELISGTPLENDHTVGYHDIKPFNCKDSEIIAIHKLARNTIGPKKNLKIDICLWNYIKNTITRIDISNAWSWEQGSRLQWINKDELIYNCVHDNKLASYIYNIRSNTKKILNFPIYSFKNKKILTLDYQRLWNFWKNYGYYLNEYKQLQNKPDNDGIYLCNLNNEKELVLSIRKAVDLCGLSEINKPFFLAHPTFNPDGSKFVSILRFFNNSGILISYLICTDLNNKISKVLAREKVSHFEWLDSDNIVVWCRGKLSKIEKMRFSNFTEKFFISNAKKILNFLSPNIRQNISSTHYYIFDVSDEKKIGFLDKKNLTEDGHPQISSNGKFVITDTYANKKGFQKLLLHEIAKDKTFLIGEFKVSEYIIKQNYKYDLHPRWNYENNMISIDSSHQGNRQTYVISLEKFINQL